MDLVQYRVLAMTGSALRSAVKVGVVIGILTLAVLCVAAPAQATATFVPNCGVTSYLDHKPTFWSAGCTGGSPNMYHAHWWTWGTSSARATGSARLRRPCGNRPCSEAGIYTTLAKLLLTRPALCVDDEGNSRRYFSRARFTVLYRGGNPFGIRPGWTSSYFSVPKDRGTCQL
jgi:hypothetical protein